MSLSIYNTYIHSLECMSEREIEAVEIILLFSGFTFGADSISEEVAGFSPFMVSLRINTVFIVSCFLLLCMLFSQLKILRS